MKRLVRYFFLWVMILFALPAWAEVVVTATVDKTSGTLEDTFVLKVQVEGKAQGDPEIPKVDGLAIRSRGTSQQIQIINGQVSRLVEYTFLLNPQKIGEFIIPPIAVAAKGEVRPSEAIRLEVSQTSSVRPQERGAFLEAQVDKAAAFVGEQILYTLQFFQRINTSEARLEKPDFHGFGVETLGEQKESERTIQGQRFRVTELRYALFPTKSGTLTIDPASVIYETMQVDPHDPFTRFGFFSSGRTVSGKVVSSALTISVSPLPADGRPENFTGLIGRFALRTEISHQRVHAGDSITLTVKVQGTGNVREIPDLDLPHAQALANTFKMYVDKPVLNVRATDEGLWGEKVSKKALVPLHAGEFRLPPVTLSYFDAHSKKFVEVKGEEYVIQVLPGAENEHLMATGGSAAVGTRKKGVEVVGEDLMPVHTKLEAVRDMQLSPREKVLFGTMAGFPALLFGFIWSLRRRQETLEKTSAVRESQKAYREAKKALREAEKRFHEKPKSMFSELARIIRFFIGRKMGMQGLSLTPREAFDQVLLGGGAREDAQEVQEILRLCEQAQYGSIFKGSGEQILKRVEVVLAKMDKSLKGRKLP